MLVALVAAGAATDCATIGRDFPVSPVHQIVIGQTTQDEIQRQFGQPWRTGIEDGKTTWTYGYYKYPVFGTKRSRDLVVRFDDRKVVSSYSFNTTDPQENVR